MTGSLSIFLPDGDSPNTDSLNTLAATITSTASANLDVSVVVPTFREVENLTTLTEQLFAALHERSLTGELIVVDDNSCDGTIELCQRLAETYPIRLVVRTEERGLATAVIRGFSEASGTYIVVMDADLSHPPTAVPTLLETLQTNQADFVIGSRYVKGGTIDESWSIFRRINSRVAGFLATGLTSAKDPMAGFFAIRRSQLGDVTRLNPCGYKIGLETIVRCECKSVAEVPIHFEDRQFGESKLNLKEQWLYVRHLLRLYAFRYPEACRFMTFGAVGLSGMIVDLVTFSSLTPSLGLSAARAAAIWVAMTWNFELNRRVTFKTSAKSSIAAAYVRFCTACLTGAALSWGTFVGLTSLSESFRNQPVATAVVGTFAAAIVNYVLCRSWVFVTGKPQQLEAAPVAVTPDILTLDKEERPAQPPTRIAA